MRLPLRGALLGALLGGLASGLFFADRFRGVTRTQEVASAVVVASLGAVTVGVGVGLLFGLLGAPIGRPSRLSMRIRGRAYALLVYPVAVWVFGYVTWLVFGRALEAQTGLALMGGLTVGSVFGLVIWLHTPADDAPAADPWSTLRGDRTATLMSALLLGLASGVATGLATKTWWGLMSGLVVGVMVLASSSWARFTTARAWLAVTGKQPIRLMTFLEDARDLGLLRQVGAVYQFRHQRLQDQLSAAWTQPVALHDHQVRYERPGTARRHKTLARSVSLAISAIVLASLSLLSIYTVPSANLTAHHAYLTSVVSHPPISEIAANDCPVDESLGDHIYRITTQPHKDGFWWCAQLPSWYWWQMGDDVGAVRVRVVIKSGETAGVVIRANPYDAGYVITMSTKGEYEILLDQNRVARTLGAGYSLAIRRGLAQDNVLTIVTRGEVIRLFVNNVFVDAITDGTLRSGMIGLEVGYSADQVDVVFSDVEIWPIHQN